MLADDSLENIKIRNEYAQYLRIMLRAGVLHGIFANSPPNILMPFPEAMVSRKYQTIHRVRIGGERENRAYYILQDGRDIDCF